jgi:hypothetical protein
MAKRRSSDGKELAQSLTEWGISHGVSDDPYLIGVSDAIYKNRDLSIWAEFEPLEYLPQGNVSQGARSIKWGRIVGITRNILVFAPVALTWKGVEEATTAFSNFVAQNSASTVNFLEFWQNGYGVLPEAWTISSVARMDYIIVGIVILLSLLATYLNEHGRSRRSIGQRSLDLDRTYLAIEIKKYLATKREVSNLTITDGISDLMRNLENTSKSLNQTAFVLERAAKKYPSDLTFRSEFKDFFNRMNKALSKKEK